MNESYQCKDWKISLATRNNLFHNNIPYVPILVENILKYLSLEDHEKNGVKTIQTLGKLIPKTEAYAMLQSLTPGNKSQFSISFKNLNVNDIYIKDSNNAYYAIWQKHNIFKVYGTLKMEESENVLEVSHLVPVYDIEGTYNVMTLLMTIARTEYRQYYRTKEQNNKLQEQWLKMGKENKRLTKKIP